MQRTVSNSAAVFVASLFSIWATPAFAYIGPGAALPAIASFLALGGVLVAAIFGLIWYPLKRLLGRTHTRTTHSNEPQQSPPLEAVNSDVTETGDKVR